MPHKNKLEPVEDGFIAFHTENGERWRHKDVPYAEGGAEGQYYRWFISDSGEQRRYIFRPKDSRDATIYDLRQQLAQSEPMTGANVGSAT